MSLIQLYHATVPTEWLDYNKHMTEGYYGVAFGFASDALLFHIGLEEYLAQTGCTFYTAQTMITFRQELKEGDSIHVTTQIIGADRKRLHVYHELFNSAAGYVAASAESMMLHYDQNVGKVTEMTDALYSTVNEIATGHASLPTPDVIGSSVRQIKK